MPSICVSYLLEKSRAVNFSGRIEKTLDELVLYDGITDPSILRIIRKHIIAMGLLKFEYDSSKGVLTVMYEEGYAESEFFEKIAQIEILIQIIEYLHENNT